MKRITDILIVIGVILTFPIWVGFLIIILLSVSKDFEEELLK